MTHRLVIIDGNALVHRAYHALPPLSTKEGTMVNAVYGFTAILLKVIKDLKPSHLTVAFDLPEPTFRHKKFESYKATRVKADQELYDQIPLVHELLNAFDIPILETPGFEADDIIGTIAKQVKNKAEVLIVTGDMDTLQLVDRTTSVVTLRKGIHDVVTYDEKAVKERYGLAPGQIVDMKALAGDSSDNIPGIRGIGIKSATELLRTFGTLEKIFEAASHDADTIKPSLREKIVLGKKDAVLSQELATIVRTIPLTFTLRDAALHTTNWEQVVTFLSRLGFTSLLRRLPAGADRFLRTNKTHGTAQKKIRQGAVRILKNTQDIDDTLRLAHAAPIRGINFLPDGEDRITAGIKAAVLCLENRSFVIPWEHMDQEQKKSLTDLLQTNLIVGHDLKKMFTLLTEAPHEHFTWGSGIPRGARLFDVMIASYLLEPGTRTHDIASLALKRHGALLDTSRRTGLFGIDVEQAAWELQLMTALYEPLQAELREAKLLELFESIEMPLVPVLARMEKYGVLVEKKELGRMEKQINERIKVLTKKIHRLAGETFNIASSLQLRDVLYHKLKLSSENIKKGKTGLSTASAELEKLRHTHPIISLIEEYRELTKLQNTYLTALPNLINEKTGRIHTSFNQTITATGRLSSSDPNLQNIPARTDLGHKIRNAFIPQKGYVMVTCDYSQIELRIAASLAHDKHMIEAFKKGQDIHLATAAALYNVPLAKVEPKMRFAAKAINFGILYGMGAFGLSWRTGLTPWEAREFIDRYFKVFSGIKTYVNETIALAKKQGYVETMFGRRRYIHEIRSKNAALRQAGERMAVNHPTQGTNADIIKKAMIEIDIAIRRNWPEEVAMILQVHDELIFEVKEKEVKKIAPKLQEIMQNIVKLSVPLDVSVGIGKSWGTAK